MRHLDEEQLLDAAEGRTLSDAELAHLEACAGCRQVLDETSRALRAVKMVEVPEPSPLFWNHLSARVREAVAAEAIAPERTWMPSPWRLGGTIAAVAVALLAILVVRDGAITERDTRAGSEAAVVIADAPLAAAEPSMAIGPALDDAAVADAEAAAALDLLVDLAGSVDWESAMDAGWEVGAGAADAALAELSGEERRELQRLLNEALSGGVGVL